MEMLREASESDTPVNVVILAGGLNTIPLYDGYVPGPKALISYEGKPSIEYVLDALCAAPGIGQICIEGPRALLQEALSNRVTTQAQGRLAFVEGGATFPDSLVIGLEHFRSSRSVLFVTADLPLLTPQAVTDFLGGCAATTTTRKQNIHVAAVPQAAYTGEYRNATKPFNRYRDIHVCHGNLFRVDTALLNNHDIRKRVATMYDGRKSGLSRLAFGWHIALTYLIGVDLLHVLTLRYMAEIASRFLGVGIIPVLVSHPEITMDVDEADDYRFVQDRLRRPLESVPK